MNSHEDFEVDVEYSGSESESTDSTHLPMKIIIQKSVFECQVVVGNRPVSTTTSIPSKISFH